MKSKEVIFDLYIIFYLYIIFDLYIILIIYNYYVFEIIITYILGFFEMMSHYAVEGGLELTM